VAVTRERGPTRWERALALRIRQLRQAAGLSQSQAARLAGVPQATFLSWEHARRVPRLDAARDLARALGVTLDELAREEEGPAVPKKRPGKKGDHS
jgi:transcriptional regulator with XRE-family HTH domain